MFTFQEQQSINLQYYLELKNVWSVIFFQEENIPLTFFFFFCHTEVEFIACVVQSAQDVRDVRKLLGEKGAGIKIIAKTGSMSAIDNLDEILAESDGVMVVRGDLGVMVREEQVFVAQKMIVSRCNAVHKPAIIATQMLYG